MLPPVPCSAVAGILAAAEGAGKAVAYVFLHHSMLRDLTPSQFPPPPPKIHLQKACKTSAPQMTNVEQGETKETQQGIFCM